GGCPRRGGGGPPPGPPPPPAHSGHGALPPPPYPGAPASDRASAIASLLRSGRSAWAVVASRTATVGRRQDRGSAAGASRDCRGLEGEGLEVGAEFVGEVGAGQGELDSGLEKAELVARVVAAAL